MKDRYDDIDEYIGDLQAEIRTNDQCATHYYNLGVALLAIVGGLKVNTDLQVLTAEKQPIEGLYAIGNCAGDIYAYDYPINVQGNSHGRCLIEGKCLGEQLAGVYQEI